MEPHDQEQPRKAQLAQSGVIGLGSLSIRSESGIALGFKTIMDADGEMGKHVFRARMAAGVPLIIASLSGKSPPSDRSGP